MAIIKCKMCGGDLNLIEGASTAECDFCGSIQTIPKVDDEKKLTLFARANRLRAACEFDKAAGIYEAIVADERQNVAVYHGTFGYRDYSWNLHAPENRGCTGGV